MKKWYTLKNRIKWAIQRVKRGYSDYDVYDVDNWFLDIMPKMLAQLRDTTHSAPLLPGTTEETCHEEWKKILDRMIFLLHDMDEETCSFKNKYEEEYYDYLDKKYPNHINDKEFDRKYEDLISNYFGQESIKAIHMNLRKQEFFDLFCRYFNDLWN